MSETQYDADDAEHDHVDFLAFDLAGETYAIEVGRVRGTVDVPPVTRVPGAAALVEGVASVDGDVTVVTDGRTVIGADERPEADPRPMLLLLDAGRGEHATRAGLVVDRVRGIRPHHVDDVVPGEGTEAGPDGDRVPFRASLVAGVGTEAEPVSVLDVPSLVDAVTVE
jgi:chemotaxis signal transduction protein